METNTKHHNFSYDQTILPEMKRQIPDSILLQYNLLSVLKYTDDRQVYLIEAQDLGQKAVLKCASGKKAALLGTEAEFLKTHRFSFLPEFYDFMEDADSAFLIREYIPGETLEEYVEKRESLSVDDALSILSAVSDCIETFHQQDPPILHRDIKPQNFLLSNDGRIIMLDVETVRRWHSSSTNDTVIIGTANTAAPEQFGYSQTSTQSDIYSLGMLFLYLLTGEYSRKKEQYAPFPHAVRHLIQKCIHFDPKRRYRSIRAMRREIAFIRRFHMRPAPFCALLGTTALFLCCFGVFFCRQQQLAIQKTRAVEFSNPRLEEAARLALDKPDFEPLTAEDLSQIHALFLVGDKTFTDWNSYQHFPYFEFDRMTVSGEAFPLDDLRYFTGLTELALDAQNLTDLSVLRKLPLETLSMKNCGITDLSALSSMEHLTHLDVSLNPVTELPPIGQLPALKILNIESTPISDIRLLAGSSLSSFNCRYTGITDFSSIASMPDLRRLEVSNVSKQDIAMINTLTGLEKLTLSNSPITSLEEIKDLTRLKDLDICLCSKIYDLEDISRFSNLESLCISYTPISDLTPLTELSRLNTLTIEYSGVRDYTPLAGCPKLRQIYLNHAMAQALNRQLPEQDYELILVD